MEKKNLFLVVSSLLVVVISVSVAYFSVQIIGEGKNVSVTSTNLQIVFEDEDGAISDSNIEPGWSSIKTFKVTNNSKSEYKYNIVLKDLVNTFVTSGYLQYKITSTNNGYNTVDYQDIPKSSTATDTVLAYNVSIPVGTTQSYTIEFKYLNDEDVNQSDDMGMKLSGSLFITEGITPTLYTKLLTYKSTRPGERKDFNTLYTKTNVSTLFTSTENDTPVYYFVGDARDNWVKFGTWSEDKTIFLGKSSDKKSYKLFDSLSSCSSDTTFNTECEKIELAKKGDSMYWRIIRTNSDGSIRLLYAGTSHNDINKFMIGFSEYNILNNDMMYAEYMYGTSGTLESNRANTNDSTIKSYIDSWYKDNLYSNYSKYLSESAVYCNDRSIIQTNSSPRTHFAANQRLSSVSTDGNSTPKKKVNPTFNCNHDVDGNLLSDYSISDMFSSNTTIGNGKLTYPVALITADEIVFAGGCMHTSSKSYYSLDSNNNAGIYRCWTMTPGSFYNTAKIYDVITTDSYINGLNNDNGNIYLYAVRPVLSLKSDNLWKRGDGTSDNPYEIILN